jgi:hypothetical protein
MMSQFETSSTPLLCEGINILEESCNAAERKLPSSAEEGWMRGVKRRREATLARADGVVLTKSLISW